MALDAYAGLAQFDLVGTREDLSDVVSEILLQDTNLLSRIGFAGEATNTTHEWLESSLNAATVVDAESGGLDAAGTNVDLDVTTGQGARVRIGALLKNRARNQAEVVHVTAIATDALTITRGYGTTSPEDHDSGSTWDIVGMPVQSGTDVTTDRSVIRTRVTNFTQIFERGVQIAGDTQAVLKAGVPDEVAYQSRLRLLELLTELDRSIIAGIKSASDGSDTVYRTMSGLIEYLSAAGGNTNSTAEAMSPDVLNAMFQQIFDDGGGIMGSQMMLAVPQAQMRKISAFDSNNVRVVPGPGMSGRFVTQFLTDLGVVLDIVVDRWIPPDTSMVIDNSRTAVVPLSGRSFGINPISVTGDSVKRQILGDYTLEVRNAGEAHAIHTNLVI